MNQQPDKFFRDKLRHYEKRVSPEAWHRLTQQVNKSNNGRLWLKIAATVLVVALAGTFVFTINSTEPEVIATNTRSPEIENPPATHKSSGENPARGNNEKKDNEETTVQHEAAPQVNVEKKPGRRVPGASLLPPAEKEETVVVEQIKPSENSETSDYQAALTESMPTIAGNEIRPKSVTIVFSAKEVNEKYLTKKREPEATSEEKESSALKKVLDKAYDLTHNQDPMGELRQKKNEILAMNFKNEKQRNESN